MSTSNCFFLKCIQVSQEAGQVVWYSRLFQNFPQFIVVHTVKGFGIVNKAEIDVFSELSCCLDDPRKDQYIENCKALMKEIKDHTDRWRNIPCSWIRMINIVKMSTQHKAIYRFNAIPIKLPMVFFTELEQIASQFVWKYRKPGIAQSNLAKEEWNWRNQPTWLQALLQSYSHQNSINWLIEKAKDLQKNIYFCFIDYTKPLTVWLTANWKILQEMGIPVHLTCLLRNLYAGQEATVKTEHGITNWFQIGEELCQGCILSPCLFNLYAAYIMQKARLDESQAGIKIVRRHTNNLRCADETTLMAESEEELKSLMMKVKGESQKAGLKLNIQKTKIMASGPITSWQID